jgi:hypothetical protein
MDLREPHFIAQTDSQPSGQSFGYHWRGTSLSDKAPYIACWKSSKSHKCIDETIIDCMVENKLVGLDFYEAICSP